MLGVGVGLVSAALGVGGGVLMVPAFVTFIPGMDLNTAKGSSLFIIVFVAALNSFRMNRGTMRSPWDVVGLVAAGSVFGGYLGGWVTGLMSDTSVTWIFVSLLAFAGIRILFLKQTVVLEEDVRMRRALSITLGLVCGFVAGATGTGGGAVLVPFVLWAGIASNERVVALSNTVMVATCAAGLMAHLMAPQTVDMAWTHGLVNVTWAPLIFLGAIAGAPYGRELNSRLSFERRRVVMATLLLALAARLLFRVLA